MYVFFSLAHTLAFNGECVLVRLDLWECWAAGAMFDGEEQSQTVDKSEPGRPDRAGQPLEAAVEGQVNQLLLCLAHGRRG